MYGSCGSLWLYVRAVFAVAAAVGGCFDCLLFQGPSVFLFFLLFFCNFFLLRELRLFLLNFLRLFVTLFTSFRVF